MGRAGKSQVHGKLRPLVAISAGYICSSLRYVARCRFSMRTNLNSNMQALTISMTTYITGATRNSLVVSRSLVLCKHVPGNQKNNRGAVDACRKDRPLGEVQPTKLVLTMYSRMKSAVPSVPLWSMPASLCLFASPSALEASRSSSDGRPSISCIWNATVGRTPAFVLMCEFPSLLMAPEPLFPTGVS